MIRNRSRRFLFYTVMKRRCVIIHRITRNKRNVLAPRITHGLDGKRPVRSRNRICVMYSHADFADDADFYYDTFLCPTKIRGYQKICVICVICVTLKICGFSPLDRTGRFPLTQRNPMKKIDEKKEKEGDHVFMTHPLFILPQASDVMPGRGTIENQGLVGPNSLISLIIPEILHIFIAVILI